MELQQQSVGLAHALQDAGRFGRSGIESGPDALGGGAQTLGIVLVGLVVGDGQAAAVGAPVDPEVPVERLRKVLVGLVQERLGIDLHFDAGVRLFDPGGVVPLAQGHGRPVRRRGRGNVQGQGGQPRFRGIAVVDELVLQFEPGLAPMDRHLSVEGRLQIRTRAGVPPEQPQDPAQRSAFHFLDAFHHRLQFGAILQAQPEEIVQGQREGPTAHGQVRQGQRLSFRDPERKDAVFMVLVGGRGQVRVDTESQRVGTVAGQIDLHVDQGPAHAAVRPSPQSPRLTRQV